MRPQLDVVGDVLRDMVLETPPNIVRGSIMGALPELLKGLRMGKRMNKLNLEQQRDFLDLFAMSAGDYLDGWFEIGADQGRLWLRWHRRQFCQPVCRRLCLCPAPPYLRRGQRQERRLGPRHRRHGRDHPGDGQGGDGGRRRDQAVEPGRRSPGRERQGDRRGDQGWGDHPRVGDRLEPQSQAALPRPDRSGGAARGIPRPHPQLALRFGHLPDECRAQRTAGFHRAARARRWPTIMPPASSWRPAWPIWSRPISTPAATAGRRSRSSSC